MTGYKAWRAAVYAYISWTGLDEYVYKSVNSRLYEAEPLSGMINLGEDRHRNAVLTALSGGRDRDWWKMYDRFDSSSGDSGKPVAWEGGFIPDRLEGLMGTPSRRGYVQARELYEKLIKLEEEHEAEASSSKSKKRKN